MSRSTGSSLVKYETLIKETHKEFEEDFSFQDFEKICTCIFEQSIEERNDLFFRSLKVPHIGSFRPHWPRAMAQLDRVIKRLKKNKPVLPWHNKLIAGIYNYFMVNTGRRTKKTSLDRRFEILKELNYEIFETSDGRIEVRPPVPGWPDDHCK